MSTDGDKSTEPAASKKPVLIVLHQEQSSPGRVGYALRKRGYRLDIRRPPLGDPLPAHSRDHSGMVVFGGPMSANDPDLWITDEMRCIEAFTKGQTPFLGLCLGAQMLCRVNGAKVYKHDDEETEIGYYPVRPTDKGLALSRDCGVDWPSYVYHWHREGFDLPKGAELLAEGSVFPHQAFRMGSKIFGLQFHPEVTYAMICRWTVRAFERMNHKGAKMPDQHRSGWYQYDHAVHQWLEGFLDHWLATE
jgi:GMP synthase (glutamine-hydrolysing)